MLIKFISELAMMPNANRILILSIVGVCSVLMVISGLFGGNSILIIVGLLFFSLAIAGLSTFLK